MIGKPKRDKVSIDDLLKVKKAERPDREFWNHWQDSFDAKLLEAKQSKRSRWLDLLAKSWLTVARWQIPLGVGALAALGYFVYVQLQPVTPPMRLSSSVEKAYVVADKLPSTPESSSRASLQSGSRPVAAVSDGSADFASVTALLGVNPFAASSEDDSVARSRNLTANVNVMQTLDADAWDRLLAGASRISLRLPEIRPSHLDRLSVSSGFVRGGNLGFSYFGSYASRGRLQDDAVESERVFETVARRLGQKADKDLSLKF